MIDFIKNLMAGPVETETNHDGELRLVAAALLFRAVYVDGKAEDGEADMVRRILHEEFGLSDDDTTALMDAAEKAAVESNDLYGWTKRVNAHYSMDEKIYLMEKLWQVVLADDHLDEHEAAMMRRLAGLIYVSDSDSASARQAALAARG